VRAGPTVVAERGCSTKDPLVQQAPAQVRPLGGRKGIHCWLGLRARDWPRKMEDLEEEQEERI
jgi:hypothetical protein